jgi:hypothetical protein
MTCESCNGLEIIDSGEYPWGETIFIPCPVCATSFEYWHEKCDYLIDKELEGAN